MTEQWGAPLQGAQMKLLRAAGLQLCTHRVISPMLWGWHSDLRAECDRHFLPADHIAYTLLEAGWLDGRNVRLWFGGDKAPEDWDGVSILTSDGRNTAKDMRVLYTWSSGDQHGRSVIAYIAKVEECEHSGPKVFVSRSQVGNVACGDCQEFLDAPTQPETVTIAKMTKAEWGLRINSYGMLFEDVEDIFIDLGLIKEPTREERFWALHEPEGATVPTYIKKWVKDALEFERWAI